jgi:hypothetical protein
MIFLRFTVFLLLIGLSLPISSASATGALGMVVRGQQAQQGTYWVQLAAVSNASAAEKIRTAYPKLEIQAYTDKSGLTRVVAGPYDSYQQAVALKNDISRQKAFVRFVPKPKKAKADNNTTGTAVEKFIAKEKADCKQAVAPRQGSADSGRECVCCVHIRNNTLIRH